MALLKAFVCQVVLLGLYKLFLEQVFEDYLVPDELTRNCLVGFVCLLCFGIQLFTDKAGDEENAETVEDPKEKSESNGLKSTKNSESIEVSMNLEAVGSSTSSRVTTRNPQTSQEIATEEKMPPIYKQVGDLRERNLSETSAEAEKVTTKTHSGMFTQFSPHMSDTVPNLIDVDCERKLESYSQETTSILELNGSSETNVCEESDEDGIEIDQFVAKESAEEPRMVQAKEMETIENENVPEKIQLLEIVEDEKVEVVEPKDAIKEGTQLIKVELKEVEATEPNVLEAVVESKYRMANGESFSSTQDSDENTTLKIDQPSDTKIASGIAEESLNNIDNTSSSIIEEFENKSIKNNSEIGNGQESTLSSEPHKQSKKNSESLQCTQETVNISSNSKKSVNDEDTMNKNVAETSKRTRNTLPTSEKLTVSTVRQKTSSEDVCVAPVTIDISFIYACH